MDIDEYYNPQQVEEQAQTFWHSQNSFEVVEDGSKQPWYALAMLPYPSGNLHMGHVRNYTICDAIARYRKMQGFNVLQPMGWDAFGLPAEKAAIERGEDPHTWTLDNIATMRKQLQQIGFAYDWRREINSCHEDYYRWEQWFFIRLMEKGIAYRKNAIVNWDPVDQTVLANEQVVDGRGWRSNALVERRSMPQWFLRITDYADELLNCLDSLHDWPEQVVTMQRNWIGKSVGSNILFSLPDGQQLEVFTTRADTLMGATYLAIAPDHPLAISQAKANPTLQQELVALQQGSIAEADISAADKKGCYLELTAKHPLSGAMLPIWATNFVLMDYGSGAIMAVPAHDQRDWEFAQTYQLPIHQVIKPADNTEVDLTAGAFCEKGVLINSGNYNELSSNEAIQQITEALEDLQLGQKKTVYRLRDWAVSRQRYWGAPIPAIHCKTCGIVPVAAEDLPVVLPAVPKAATQGSSSLTALSALTEFVQVVCPRCQGSAQRDTDTFDTFMESSWYFLRYTCADNNQAMVDERTNYWMPINQYVGGVEHAVMHLLYARFFHKLMRDEGLVNCDEPFTGLLTQGMVNKDGSKMSKSKGNVVSPQPLIEKYGADTLRLFVLFAAPPRQTLEWSETGVQGASRFLRKLWQSVWWHLQQPKAEPLIPSSLGHSHLELYRLIQKTVEQATQEYEDRLNFNTTIAAVMTLHNATVELMEAIKKSTAPEDLPQALALHRHCLSTILLILSPVTPHICHVLWQHLGHHQPICDAPWPVVDKDVKAVTQQEIAIQVNGKLRGSILCDVNLTKTELEQQCLSHHNVVQHISNHEIIRIIHVPGRLVNVVIRTK